LNKGNWDEIQKVVSGLFHGPLHARILILTRYPTNPLARKALEAGARALIKKPFEIGKILDFFK